VNASTGLMSGGPVIESVISPVEEADPGERRVAAAAEADEGANMASVTASEASACSGIAAVPSLRAVVDTTKAPAMGGQHAPVPLHKRSRMAQ
jgi:hypothetical protein